MKAKAKTTNRTTNKTTPTARKRDAEARFMIAYDKASPANKRAIEVALTMLTEGAPAELTERVAVKLSDMWRDE